MGTDKTSLGEQWYDIREDWELIEASFAAQYGIRLRKEGDMPWREFTTLLTGLMGDTPLGQIINIRAEKDITVIKKYNASQKRIYNDWRNKIAKAKLVAEKDLEKDMKILEATMERMFGGG